MGRNPPPPHRGAPRILYIDPWSGISGDMLLGALLSLDREGAAERLLRETVAALGLPDVVLDVHRESRGGLMCTRVEVSSAAPPPLRTLGDLRSVIDRSGLRLGVKEAAVAALTRLADVEGRLHGVPPDTVHFHEIGAVDTVVDVVGVLALVDVLEVDQVVHGPVPVGGGTVETAHGRLGVPAPAALELLRGARVVAGDEQCELTTPTGALLLSQLGAVPGPLPDMVVEKVGYGGGSRELQHGPNLLRLILGTVPDVAGRSAPPSRGTPVEAAFETVVVLQAAVDDSSPEILAHLQDALLAQGALDAWWTPVSMKKGRMGSELTALCRASDEATLVGAIFRESSTFGVRRAERQRYVLERDWITAEVGGESVRVKLGRLGREVVTVAPEFEDARRVARRLDLPLREVMTRAAQEARRSFSM